MGFLPKYDINYDIMKAIDVAKWFINETSPDQDPLKLQKLIYLAQGFSFAFNDKELFNEDMEAWVHGPVIKSICQLFKNYRYEPIVEKYKLSDIDKDSLSILEYVRDNYSQYEAKFLEELSHSQDPWNSARDALDYDELSNKAISKYQIANYFTNLIYQPSLECDEY